MTIQYRPILLIVGFVASLGAFARPAFAGLVVDPANAPFAALAQAEITAMAEGRRGPVSAELIRRFSEIETTTTIKPLTLDEETWHPNDRKGTRSHVVPLDTKMRGAIRTSPTSAVIYLHVNRVDPQMNLYKMGSLANLLARALDLNQGQFSGNHTIQEKRAVFFQNGWRDSKGLVPFQISDGVPTPEYLAAKKAGYLTASYARHFPILNLKSVTTWSRTDISTYAAVGIGPQIRSGDVFVGKFRRGESFLKAVDREGARLLRFGSLLEGRFEIFERRLDEVAPGLNLQVGELGVDFAPLIEGADRVADGDLDRGPGSQDLWTRETAELRPQNN
jgi:hypothetical protein